MDFDVEAFTRLNASRLDKNSFENRVKGVYSFDVSLIEWIFFKFYKLH